MDDRYSPHTGEYVPLTDDLPDWLARAGTVRPDYDPATQSVFWRGEHWEIVNGPTAADLLAGQVRTDRDARLAQLDAIVTNPLRWAAFTPEAQTALAAYRQALLDVPQQAGFP